VSGCEKLDRLDHEGNQQRSIANVQNDGSNTCTQQTALSITLWNRWPNGNTSFTPLWDIAR